MAWLLELSNYFWSPSFWLPPTYEWEDLEYTRILRPKYDLLYPIQLALVLVVLQIVFERYICVKLGRRLGISGNRCSPPPYNYILETCYVANNGGHPTRTDDFTNLTRLTGMDRPAIEQWYLQRTLSARPTNLTHFAQSFWRGTCHLLTFSIGIAILWDAPYLWNLENCWIDYPYHGVTGDIQGYYLIVGAVYLSLATSLFYGDQGPDYWPRLFYSITMLTLMTLSWYSNFRRFATLILFQHDAANIPLYFARVAHCTQKKNGVLSKILYFFFLITWIPTRLYYLPFYLLKSITSEALDHIESFPVFSLITYVANFIFCLNIYWTWHIVRTTRRHFQNATAGVASVSPEPTSRRTSSGSSESNSRTEVEGEEEDDKDSTSTLDAKDTSDDEGSNEAGSDDYAEASENEEVVVRGTSVIS